MANDEVRTDRLLLRRWRPEDAAPMAAINRDPEVAEFLNRPVDEAAVASFHGLMVEHWAEHGFGPYAVESTEPEHAGTFLGFVGFAYLPPFLAAAGEGPELGWRLARAAWGRGLATEAARAALAAGQAERPEAEVISVIHPENERSQRVAAKLGMRLARQVPNPLLGRDTDVWVLPHPRG
jgi:RimJ/RimL family protein N-acetyltransferase